MTNKPEPNTRAGEALKPCPFCGGEAIPEQYVRDGSGISCGDCNTKIWEYHGPPHMPSAQDRCRVRWNTRPLPQPSELVERLRATIIQDVCELPDYNSPDDQPDLLQCTVEELQIILTRNLEAFGQCDLTDFAPLTNSALRAQIAKLQARLEVVPGWSEDADGIACRNDTIKLQDECIAKLQADGDKLAGAATALRDDMLMRAEMHKHRNNGELVVEAGNGVWHRINAALTEWKDRA